MFSIEFEPLSLGKLGGIEDPIPPMGVIVTAGTDEDHISDCGLKRFRAEALSYNFCKGFRAEALSYNFCNSTLQG